MNSRLCRVENWVEHAKAAKFSASGLARRCGVSLRQLERFFLETYGKTPQRWFEKLRQHDALPMLIEGFSVKETADALGYHQQSNFCRAFKRVHGMPPSHVQRSPAPRREMSQNDKNVAFG